MRHAIAWPLAVLLPLVLTACTTADSGMGMSPPGAIAGGGADIPDARSPDSFAAPVKSAPADVPAASGAAQAGPIQFLPLVGAPADKVATLSQALAESAAANGVALAPASGPVAPQRLKGYLSVLVEGRATAVIYVWDVVDPQGVRLNRIQGQQRVEAADAGDPWSVVDGQTLAAIAAKTMAAFTQGGAGAG